MSFDDAAVADQGVGDADEGEEVLRLAFGAAAMANTALQLGTALGAVLFSSAEGPTGGGFDTHALYGAAGLTLVAGLCAAALIRTAAPAGVRAVTQAGSRLPEQ